MKKLFLGILSLLLCVCLCGCGSATATTIGELSNQLDETANTVSSVQTVSTTSLASSDVSNFATTQSALEKEESYKAKIIAKTAQIKNSLSGELSLSKAQISAVKELSDNLNKYTNSVAYTKNELENTVKSITSLGKNSAKNTEKLNAKFNRLTCNSNARASYYENILNTLEQLDDYFETSDNLDDAANENETNKQNTQQSTEQSDEQSAEQNGTNDIVYEYGENENNNEYSDEGGYDFANFPPPPAQENGGETERGFHRGFGRKGGRGFFNAPHFFERGMFPPQNAQPPQSGEPEIDENLDDENLRDELQNSEGEVGYESLNNNSENSLISEENSAKIMREKVSQNTKSAKNGTSEIDGINGRNRTSETNRAEERIPNWQKNDETFAETSFFNSNNINRAGVANGGYGANFVNGYGAGYPDYGAGYSGYGANAGYGAGYNYGANGFYDTNGIYGGAYRGLAGNYMGGVNTYAGTNGAMINSPFFGGMFRFNPNRNTDTYAPILKNIDTYRANSSAVESAKNLESAQVNERLDERLESVDERLEDFEELDESNTIRNVKNQASANQFQKIVKNNQKIGEKMKNFDEKTQNFDKMKIKEIGKFENSEHTSSDEPTSSSATKSADLDATENICANRIEKNEKELKQPIIAHKNTNG